MKTETMTTDERRQQLRNILFDMTGLETAANRILDSLGDLELYDWKLIDLYMCMDAHILWDLMNFEIISLNKD